MAEANPFNLARLVESLRPFKLHYFPELPSTNDKALEMRRSGDLFAPAIVLTGRQTAGRGRGANRWLSSAASLTVTYVLPIEENLQAHQLPLVAGLAVRNAAAELTGNVDISLKWPNDVVHAARKVAGLLCERMNGIDIIGVGMNVNDHPTSAEVRTTAISLATIAGQTMDLNDVLITMTAHLKQSLTARHSQPFGVFLEEYRQHDALLGREIAVDTPGGDGVLRGTCEGIDKDGWLLLRADGRLHRIIAGSITAMTQVM